MAIRKPPQQEAPPRPVIPCCFDECLRPALCRVHTATGWANVCEYHYPQIERVPAVANSPVIDEVLKAWRASKAFKARSEGRIGEFMREPGQDVEEVA